MADMIVRNQKMIRVGNSYALTLDPKFITRHNLDPKTKFKVSYSGDVAALMINKDAGSQKGQGTAVRSAADKKAYMVNEVDREFREWVDKSLTEDAESLKELANK